VNDADDGGAGGFGDVDQRFERQPHFSVLVCVEFSVEAAHEWVEQDQGGADTGHDVGEGVQVTR
jgi:hypothetical protein